MDERKQYWEDAKESWYPQKHALLELRATLAWELIGHFGSVSGVFMDREDSAKRAVMELQTPGALVTRCFAIADAFVNRAENREEIRQLPVQEIRTLSSSVNDITATVSKLANHLGKPEPPAGVPVPHKQEPANS